MIVLSPLSIAVGVAALVLGFVEVLFADRVIYPSVRRRHEMKKVTGRHGIDPDQRHACGALSEPGGSCRCWASCSGNSFSAMPCAGCWTEGGAHSMKLGRAARSLFLAEFVSALVLGMRYFFAPKATLNYPFEKGPLVAALSRRTCAQALSQRRRALHRLQAVRGHLSGPGDHHRGRSAPRGRHPAHHPL